MGILENIADIMQAQKQSRGDSVEHFSEQLEISPSMAQDYLKARGNPTVKTIEHLAEKLGLSLRVPMQVTRIRLLYPTGAYPMCAKCGSTMEQEYQDFCVFCGQRLDWEVYQKAVGTPPGGKGDRCQKTRWEADCSHLADGYGI